MRARRWRPAVAVSASALAAAGCATIMTGTTDEITLTSEPSGVQVRIQPGPERVRTPGVVGRLRSGDPGEPGQAEPGQRR